MFASWLVNSKFVPFPLPCRPDGSLIHLRNRPEPLVHKPLDTLSFIRLGRVNVAPGTRRDAVHGVELSRLPPPIAECREGGERVPLNDVHLFVGAIREIEVLLFGVTGERDVPHGSVTESPLRNEHF